MELENIGSNKSLLTCIPLAEALPDFSIVSTLSRQLRWTHFLDMKIQKQGIFNHFRLQRRNAKRMIWEVEDGG